MSCGADYYGARFRGYGRARAEYDTCCEPTPFCAPAVTTVNCVINTACCDDVVRLHITGRFAELGLEKCFKLLLCQNSMQNINTKPVYLVDGIRAFPLIQAHTGNIIHYDQLCALVDFHKRKSNRRGGYARYGYGYNYGYDYGYGYNYGGYGHGCGCGPREIALDCYMGSDGPVENGLHVLVRTRLPKTTFTPLPDIEGPVQGGEPFQGPVIDS